MCGLCNLVRCITGRTNGYSNTCRRDGCRQENLFDGRVSRFEPSMKIHCAGDYEQASACRYRATNDCDCGCRRDNDCD